MAANYEGLKKIIKKIAFGRNQNFFSGNVIALCVDSDEKIKKKFVKVNLNLKKKSKKNNFAGGLGCKI